MTNTPIEKALEEWCAHEPQYAYAYDKEGETRVIVECSLCGVEL